LGNVGFDRDLGLSNVEELIDEGSNEDKPKT